MPLPPVFEPDEVLSAERLNDAFANLGADATSLTDAFTEADNAIRAILPVNVRFFGALGNGVHDDTAAIQAAANAGGYGCTLHFGQGRFLVSSTITLPGACKLVGEGPYVSEIYRATDYGDTFVCGTNAVNGQGVVTNPARDFSAKGLRFSHLYIGGTAPNFDLMTRATSGAHIHLRGAQGAIFEDCEFTRMPVGVLVEGGTLSVMSRCKLLGVYDPATPALQEGLANVRLMPSALHGACTTWQFTKCDFFGLATQRAVTYGATTVTRADTIGVQHGLMIDSMEDLVVSECYFGGQSASQIGMFGAAGAGLMDIRITGCFFDGISKGSGILIAPAVNNVATLAVQITDNVFTDQYNSVFINENIGGSGVSAYGTKITGNIFMSAIGTPIRLLGAVGFDVSDNQIGDYNKHNLTTTDTALCAAVAVGNYSRAGTIEDNRIGGGGNSFVNDVNFNFCYAGVVVDAAIGDVEVANNTYRGIRKGSLFYTGKAGREGQAIVTTGTSFQMLQNHAICIVNKTTDSATAVALPVRPVAGQVVHVKDGKGDAATNAITVTTNDSSQVEGGANLVLNTNRVSAGFRFNGSGWDRIG